MDCKDCLMVRSHLAIWRKKVADSVAEIPNPPENRAASGVGSSSLFSAGKAFARLKPIRAQYEVRLPNAPSGCVRIFSVRPHEYPGVMYIEHLVKKGRPDSTGSPHNFLTDSHDHSHLIIVAVAFRR